jgi:hypothetical protein
LDILLGNIIYRNNGNSTFTDINAGLSYVGLGSVAWGDCDNDGDLDILLSGGGNSKVYRNNGENTFTDINAGLQGVTKSSAAWGDYDNDGDLDVLITGYSGSNNISKVYRNNGGVNNWLSILTRGIVSNSQGLGAKVSCVTVDNQLREISSDSGWINGVAHFGLGNLNNVDQVQVYWPKSGITDNYSQLQANQSFIIYEGNFPLISSIVPNGGEVLPGASGQNNSYPITWSIENLPTGTYHITLFYSLDGGVTYPNLIAANETNDGSYTWTVPNIASTSVRIKLQVKNSSGVIIAEKNSSGNFTIDATPPTGSISLTLPTNGAWVSSTPYFDWSTSGLTDVTNMAIIVDGAYLVQGLSTTAANSFYQTPLSLALSDGWHTWTVRGLDAAGNWVQATQSWSIRVDATPPSQFSLNTPTDNLWLATQSPTFVWNASMDNGSGM